MEERSSALEFRRAARPPPEAERALFELLRSSDAGRGRWRRQHPVGPYVVAFCCPERALAVEIEAERRAPDARFHDEVRARYLAGRGLRLVTFTPEQVISGGPGVALAVAAALAPASAVVGRGRAR